MDKGRESKTKLRRRGYTCEHYVKWFVHVPKLFLILLQKAMYLFQTAFCYPCGSVLFKTKPLFALNACTD